MIYGKALSHSNGDMELANQRIAYAVEQTAKSYPSMRNRDKAMDMVFQKLSESPKKHYKLKSLEVTDANGKQITVTQDEKGNYCVAMPDSAVKVTVKFKVKYTSIADSPNPKTGDFSLVFWSGMMATTMLGAAALLSKKKYFEQ